MYQQHPLSAVFPGMSSEDFHALKDSIENIGVQNPVTLLDGMVIDGWHRYTAANELGIDCPTVDLGDVDPRDFVLAQNKARRHITQSQLAMATTSVYAWAPEGRQKLHTECAVKTTAEMADIAGVHRNTIVQAQAVRAKATPEVIAAVKAGEIGLPKAARIAQLPKEAQAEAIAKPIPRPVEAKMPHHVVHDERDDMLQLISKENDDLRDRLAIEAMDASEEEKTLAHQTITEMRERVRVLEIELQAVKDMRDAYQRENAEMKRQIASMQRKIGGV